MSPARNRVRRRRQEPTDLGSLLDADLGMVTLVAGSTKLGVHRAVLAARSAPLAAMLRRLPSGADGCPELALPDLEGPVLIKLVGFIYALKLNRLDGLGPQLLAAADRYSVVGLRDAVQSLMVQERLAHSRLHA